MVVSEEVEKIISSTILLAKEAGFEFVVPELMLYVICGSEVFQQAFENCGGSVGELDYHLKTYLESYLEGRELPGGREPELSRDMRMVLEDALETSQNSGRDRVELPHVLHAMYGLEDSYAAYYLLTQGVGRVELLRELGILYEETQNAGVGGFDGSGGQQDFGKESGAAEVRGQAAGWQAGVRPGDGGGQGRERQRQGGRRQDAEWQQCVVCLNDVADREKPLIGREEELERTMQVLCRREKNNPLHIGEPGVGKTAVTYGLARLLEEGRVPEPLQGAKIFSLDLGSLLAGTQYRGDFEQRFRKEIGRAHV